MNILQIADTKDIPDVTVVKAELWAADKDTRQAMLNSVTVKIMEEFVDFTFDCNHQPQTNTECDYRILAYTKEVMSLGLFYEEYGDAVRERDGKRVLLCFKCLLPLYKGSNRKNYSY